MGYSFHDVFRVSWCVPRAGRLDTVHAFLSVDVSEQDGTEVDLVMIFACPEDAHPLTGKDFGDERFSAANPNCDSAIRSTAAFDSRRARVNWRSPLYYIYLFLM